jgi:hypothetical protein
MTRPGPPFLTAVGQRQRENALQAGKVPGKGDR